jgi:hypothetical protein
MMPKRFHLLMPVGLALAVTLGDVARADDPAEEKVSKPDSKGLSTLLGFIGNRSLPSLDGLIRPEKMGLLTDNQLHAEGNDVRILSDLRSISGITVIVNITINGSNDNKVRGKKRKGRHRRKTGPYGQNIQTSRKLQSSLHLRMRREPDLSRGPRPQAFSNRDRTPAITPTAQPSVFSDAKFH